MKERARERHGLSHSPTYHSWAMMKQRCLNQKTVAYKRYGGRGIKICPQWVDSFETFLKDMGEKPDGLSLGRIDNEGDYCPENCRWETYKEQARNTRRTKRVKLNGSVISATAAAEELGLPLTTYNGRLQMGWTPEQALGLEKHYPDTAITFNGETMVMAQWAKKLGISRQGLDIRFQTGWSIEEALSIPKGGTRASRVKASNRKQPAERRKHNYKRGKQRKDKLGIFLTAQRQGMNMTQRSLASMLDTSDSRISQLELGRAMPTMKEAIQLAKIFGVSLDEFASHIDVSMY